MPAFTITPLSTDAAYDGTLFIHADPAVLFSYRIAFEQIPLASKEPTTLSCRPHDVETRIIPLLSSKGSAFKPVRICANPTPGAITVSRRDGVQHHIWHGGLPVIDYRTLNANIASAHLVSGVHRSLAETLASLESFFSLVPVDYVTTVLSLCSSCSGGRPSSVQDVSIVEYSAESLPASPRLPSSRKRPSSTLHTSPSSSRKKRPRHAKKLSPYSPKSTPSTSFPESPRYKTELECAGVTDEIADMMDEECESHEEFLLLMHAVYEKAGLPADRLIGRKEDLEAYAEADEYYFYDY